MRDKKIAYEKGRPSTYTKELADMVCEIISTHACGLNKLHDMYEDFPPKGTIFRWMFQNPAFRDQYLNARQAQTHAMADSVLDIVMDIPTYVDRDHNERIDAGILGKARLEYEIKKWHMSKLEPKIYGDHKQIEDLQGQNAGLQDEINKIKAELEATHKREY